MNDSHPLERYLVPLRRWWPLLAGGLLLGLVLAWLTLPEPPPEPTAGQAADPTINYRATHILLRNPDSPSAANLDLVQLLARQGDLTNRVVERMDERVTPMDVDAVILEAAPDIGTLSVMAVQPTPELAAELTSTYAMELNALLQERDERSLRQSLNRATERLAGAEERVQAMEQEIAGLPEDDLDRRLLEAELDILINEYAAYQAEVRALTSQQVDRGQPFETVQEASPVTTVADVGEATLEFPDDSRARFALWAFIGLLVGIGAVFVVNYLDTRVRTRQDAEDAFGLPVIAEVPRRPAKLRAVDPVAVRGEPDGVTAESIRSLRLAVSLAPTWRLSERAPAGHDAVGSVAPIADHGPPSSLLVTSPLTGDGKTTLVANLAASFAEAGQRVLVVDCDFRRPAVAALLGANPAEGLRDLKDPYEQPLKDLIVPTVFDDVELVGAGSPGIAPPWFLGHAQTIVEQATDIADVVLLDTGPLLLTNEASALTPFVDTLLLVARSGRFNRAQARDSVQRLTRVGANVGGVVLIGSDPSKRYGYYEPDRGSSGRAWAARGGPPASSTTDVEEAPES
jgi:capsular exopolysaccharide synthesis family protein